MGAVWSMQNKCCNKVYKQLFFSGVGEKPQILQSCEKFTRHHQLSLFYYNDITMMMMWAVNVHKVEWCEH